jgi:hypothetical protein
VWFDANQWVQAHLEQGLPRWRVAPETDPGDPVFPACLWSLLLAEVTDGLWSGHLTCNILVPTMDAAVLTERVADLLMSWRPPGPAADVTGFTAVQRATTTRQDLTLHTLTCTVLWTP